MNKITILIFWISISFVSFGQETENQLIRFDGIYKTKCISYKEDGKKEREQSWLRFYPDGKVISVGTDCTSVYYIKRWFNINHKNISIGNYEINGREIRFSTTSSAGIVNYAGEIDKNGLIILKVTSLINGFEGEDNYKFVKVNDLQ